MNATQTHHKSFLLGSFSGGIAIIVAQPFDVIKTSMQVQSLQKQVSVKNGILSTVRSTISDGGYRSLWRGTVASLYRAVPGTGLYFGSLSFIQWTFLGNSRYPHPMEAATFGVIARSFAVCCLMPFTVIKTQFESGLFRYKSVFQAGQSIVAKNGIKGLYRGVTATLVRDVPYSAVSLFFYSYFKSIVFSDPRHANSIPGVALCTTMAGFCATMVTHPADVIKTRRQLRIEENLSLRHITKEVLQMNGVSGLFRGVVPRCCRRITVAVVTWTIFEKFNQTENTKQ